MPFNYQPLQQSFSQMGPGQGPLTGADFNSGASPMLDPKSSISPMPQPVPEQTPGAPEEPIKQPGNRRSIKEYLEQIKMLRAQGQEVVPTFTNIQGGGLDVSQGQIDGQNVQSYVSPEYVQGETGTMTRGEAHPVTQAQQATYGEAGGEGEGPLGVHWTNEGWANKRAMKDSDEVMQAVNDQMIQTQGREATQEEVMSALNQYRLNLYKKQAEMWKDLKKQYPDASTNELMESYRTGDFNKVLKAGENAFSEKSVKERTVALGEEYIKYIKKEGEVPTNTETGEPFARAEDYVQYHLNEYEETMASILELASQRSQEEGNIDANNDLMSELDKVPVRKGNDGKSYKTYKGRTFLVGE